MTNRMTEWPLTDDDALEADVADVQQGRQDAHYVHDLLLFEQQHLHGRPDLGELVGVVPALASDAVPLHHYQLTTTTTITTKLLGN